MDRKDSANEMRQIQEGLESFLEREVEGYTAENRRRTPGREENGAAKEDLTSADGFSEEEEDFPREEDEFSEEEEDLSREEDESPSSPKEKEVKKGSMKDKKKKRKKKHRLRRFLTVILILALLLCAGWYYVVGLIYDEMTYVEISSVTSESMKEDGVTNILLIGNDSRTNDDDGRSDAMILVSISQKTHTIYLTSLLRDMYVTIPGYQDNRLNAAYSYGGAELLMATIEENFDISVDRYVSVNFEAFANLVDAVGGVDVEVTNEEVVYINGYLVEYNILTGKEEGTDYLDDTLSGLVHLNGPQALAYCRIRYIGTDFARTQRQRTVLTAVLNQLPSALLSDASGLVESLFPNLSTNLSKQEFFALSLQAYKLLTYDVEQITIPQDGTYSNATIREMSVLEVDFDANNEYIRQTIYGEEN